MIYTIADIRTGIDEEADGWRPWATLEEMFVGKYSVGEPEETYRLSIKGRKTNMANQYLDVSDLVWTEGPAGASMERSVCIMQDFDHSSLFITGEKERPLSIYYGDAILANGVTGGVPTWLAVRWENGSYLLERAERYMEYRNNQLALDLLNLLEQFDRIPLKRTKRVRQPISREWRDGTFSPESRVFEREEEWAWECAEGWEYCRFEGYD